MSGPSPTPPAAPGAKPRSPYLVPVLAVGAVAAVVGAVVMFGGSSARMSDGSDVTAADPDLKELVEGVQFRDIKTGTGEPCPEGAAVKVHYTGWLTDGTVFDSSRDRGKTADFTLDGVIPGWQVGIPGMKKGGVRKLVIDPAMGYGGQAKGKIPANSVLIFEVEMLGFKGGDAPAGPAPTKLSDGTAPGADDPGLKDIGGGLKIRDLKEGTGDVVQPGATVVAHYTGWLTSGKSFDSSVPRGEPSTFPLGNVVPGWQKGLPGMKVGGVRKLVIPPDMAYGANGRPGIPPNSTLVFEVEILGTR